MLNIGISEVLLVLLIAFLVVGPKDLPKVGAWLGRGLRKIRALLREVREEAGLESVDQEVKELQKDLHQIRKDADPTAGIREELKAARDETRGTGKGADPDENKPEK